MQTLVDGIILSLALLFTSAISTTVIHVLVGLSFGSTLIVFLVLSFIAFCSWAVCAANQID